VYRYCGIISAFKAGIYLSLSLGTERERERERERGGGLFQIEGRLASAGG
jgi:hypothetical protein